MEIMDDSSDILVIGSGIAGLFFALKVADFASVTVVTKKEKAESNTNYAQGGIAVVMSSLDSFEDHIKDTLMCGDGLSKVEVVKKIVKEGPARIQELEELGVEFTQTSNGALDLGIEGGHSKRRIVHAKDLTGREIERALLEHIIKHPSIRLLENNIAINLVVKDNRCVGCYILDANNSIILNFSAKIVVLTTGGIGYVYLHTTNPLSLIHI